MINTSLDLVSQLRLIKMNSFESGRFHSSDWRSHSTFLRGSPEKACI